LLLYELKKLRPTAESS